MAFEHVEQVRVHERLAADDAEEDVAHRLGFADQLVEGVRLNVSCLAATSTQQPWQRRLQLLMIETYRNGGKNSPRFSRCLCFCTDRMPFKPMFHASFQSRRLSVSNSTRLAILSKYIIVLIFR